MDSGMNAEQSQAMMDIAREAGRGALQVIQQQLAAGWPAAPVIAMNLQSMYLIGLTVGLKVGLTDIVSARKLLALMRADQQFAVEHANLPPELVGLTNQKLDDDVDRILHLVERL